MEARKLYEQQIMERVRLLPEDQLAKVISMLETLKTEEQKKQDYLKAIEELRGKYRDELSSTEEFMRRKEEEKRLDL